MRRQFVAGNWKMNTTLQTGQALATGLAREVPAELPGVEVAVCPPFPYLGVVGAAVAGSGVALGAQTASHENPGAFTGEVAAEMLKDLGCRWVVLGHSERRQYQNESDELISRKARKVLDTGLNAILCVGETLSQRNGGQTDAVLDGQMAGSLSGIAEADLDRMVIAYEPVWAIGTGVTATTEQAESAHRHLRTWLANRYNSAAADRVRILYGGSVKASNAATLLAQPNVDGALVGGASLKLDDFLPIIRAAESISKSSG